MAATRQLANLPTPLQRANLLHRIQASKLDLRDLKQTQPQSQENGS
jgi:hypothetical protein